MKHIRFSEAEKYEPQKGWKRLSLCSENEISIEHFIKPPGHSSPEHSHPNVQVLVVLKGKLQVVGEEETVLLGEGDTIYIPGNEKHIVTNPSNEESVGIDIFIPGRSFDFWKNKMKG